MSHRILIVEEHTASRELMAAAVGSMEGVEVFSVPSGFEALKLLPRFRFDLIITDAQMPDMDGLELVNFVRKSPPYRSTPLVLVSHDEHHARGLSMGASAVLSKPVAPDDLTSVVRDHLMVEVPVAVNA